MGTASGQFRKTAENAPDGQADYCTYVEVYGKYRTGVTDETCNTTYRLYLGGNNIKDYNLLRNHAYTVNVTLRGQNEADMRVGTMLESANCFMVSQPSTEYMFDATVMGNGSVTPPDVAIPSPAIVPTPLAPDGAMLVWETGAAGDVIAPGSVKLSEDRKFISFRTSGTIGGNALIAATQGGEIIWSWHIWSTTYDPNTDYDTYVTRTIYHRSYNSLPSREIRMMRVNLGAAGTAASPEQGVSGFGLFYQWGRKDPFIGPATVTSEQTNKPFTNLLATTNAAGYEWGIWRASTGTNSNNIPLSITKPTRMFTSAIGWFGRFCSFRNGWGNPSTDSKTPNPKDGAKSIYDPCPKGWRVPPSDTWTMFTTSVELGTNKPAEFNVDGGWLPGFYCYYSAAGSGKTAFYPAAGGRNDTKGNWISGGLKYWSSSGPTIGTTSNYGCLLYVTSSMIYPQSQTSQSETYPVRCAKEE